MLDTLMTGLSAPAFSLGGAPVTRIELLGFALAIWMVLCNIRVNPLGWPLAILSSGLYALLFWQSRLYGEAALQLLFILVALWGWHQWLKPPAARMPDGLPAGTSADASPALPTHRLPRHTITVLAALTLLGSLALGNFLAQHSDSDVPYLDAISTVGSLVGQWLLARKYAENWLVWLMVNLLSVVLFAVKGLWLTTLLYAMLAGLSLAGWRAWRQQLSRSAVARPPAAS